MLFRSPGVAQQAAKAVGVLLGQLHAERVVVAAAAVVDQLDAPEGRVRRAADDGAGGAGNGFVDGAERLQLAGDGTEVADFESHVLAEFALHVEEVLQNVGRAAVIEVGEGVGVGVTVTVVVVVVVVVVVTPSCVTIKVLSPTVIVPVL